MTDTGTLTGGLGLRPIFGSCRVVLTTNSNGLSSSRGRGSFSHIAGTVGVRSGAVALSINRLAANIAVPR